MINEEEYNAHLTKLLDAGVDEREAPTRAVLTFGLQHNNITEEEAENALSILQDFLFTHKGYRFLSPREKYNLRQSGVKIDDREEKEMWKRVQPILDKAQGFSSPTNPTVDMDEECDDIPELTAEQVEHIKEQQRRATAAVTDPSSPFFVERAENETEEEYKMRVRTASRELMRCWEHTLREC